MIVMDTVVIVTAISPSKSEADKAMDALFTEFERLEGLFNFFSDESEISLINRLAGTEAASVSTDTFELVKEALRLSKETEGAYDPTIGPVMTLWDFHKEIMPVDEEVKERLEFVNYKKVILNEAESSVMLVEKGMLLDLGGIAKGYAADRGVEVLKKRGIAAGIVAVAGDIRTFGRKPGNGEWRIGIRAPRGGPEDLSAVITMEKGAISTSGDYERFFLKDNIRYHHLLDPATGYPATGLRSVSVISDKGVLSDALSTALFIAGGKKRMKLIEKFKVKTFIVYSNGQSFHTDNLKDSLKMIDNNRGRKL